MTCRVLTHLLKVAQRDSHIKDFGRHLILLAHIFDHLPRYKAVARFKVNSLLEDCLLGNGGWGFVFNLGMLLDQGKCSLALL